MEAPVNQPMSDTPQANPTQEPDSQTVEQCINYLRRKDDTSRFVGLAMLSSFLTHIQDVDVLTRCWKSLNPRFLDRLLKSGATSQKSPEEARDMVELAVHVTHAFSTLLPNSAEEASLVGRAPLLTEILPKCSIITQATILQTLLVFSTGRKGSEVIAGIKDLSPLIKCSVEHETAMQILQHAFVRSISEPLLVKDQLKRLLPLICEDILATGKASRSRILSFLSDLLARLPSELLPPDTNWVRSAYTAIRAVITSGHNSHERSHCTKIAASLLHKYPPSLLFGPKALGKAPANEEKPFVYFFMQLVLIDLRATFPALLEQLATPSYGSTAHRLASDFDVLAAFLGYLLMVEDFDDIPITPDLLLKLKADIGETFGLTLEFLRDRWDAGYAGAAGFEPGFEKDTPLSITWETKLEGGIARDPLVIAAVRALSLWLKEDESLRKESGGLTDLFLGLWKKGKEDGVDHRFWILSSLEGTVEEDNGREQFLQYQGIDLIWADLKAIYVNRGAGEDDLRIAFDEARVLTQVVILEDKADEVWVKDVLAAVNIRGDSVMHLELDAAIARLASACLVKTHKAARRRLKDDVQKVKEVCERLFAIASERTEDGRGIAELVGEAVEELDGV
ncbi:Neurochondrin-domain-containing protein [Tuber indicum]|nr:Neurochondrin-domain-containing protein [Tuber indicum]